MDDDSESWARFVEAPRTETGLWAAFCKSALAEGATDDVLELVRSRVPLVQREPSVALYQGLLLFHQKRLSESQLVAAIDENEALDREVRADLLRARFRVLR